MACFIRVRSHQHGHHIGTHGMGDPGFVAGDFVNITLLHAARFQRGQIRACVGFGENGSGQDLAGTDGGQLFFFLRLRATIED